MNAAHGILGYWGICVVLYSVSLTGWTKGCEIRCLLPSLFIYDVPSFWVFVKAQSPVTETKQLISKLKEKSVGEHAASLLNTALREPKR